MNNLNKLFLLVCLANSSAIAGSASAPLNATAKLNASCVVSATNVSFGQITAQSTGDAFSNSEIRVKCTKSTVYKVGIMNSTIALGVQSSDKWSTIGWIRRMVNGNQSLTYNLFKDAGRTQVFGGSDAWGQGNVLGDSVMVIKSSTGQEDVIPVYAALNLNQFVSAGNYSDSLVIAVTY